MSDSAWTELSALTERLEELRDQLERAPTFGAERSRTQVKIDQVNARRLQLIRRVCAE